MMGASMHGGQAVTAAARPDDDGNELRERYTRMVRVLLFALLAVLLLIIGLVTAILGPDELSVRGVILLLGMSGLVLLALLRLQTGRLGQAVGLVVLATLGVLALETIEGGVVGSSTFLFAYTVPIAFAGLLLGRAALLATGAASVLILGAVYFLERAGVAWVATDVEGGDPETVLIVFVLIVGLLAFVLERFGVELMEAHGAALRRERQLSYTVGQLEREIEERKQAQLERDRSEESLLIASEALNIGTWTWDRDTGEMFWSDPLRRLLGVSPGRPPSLGLFLERVHPEERTEMERASAKPDTSTVAREQTYRVLGEDGSVRWVTVRFRTFPSEQGQGKQVGVMYDVTERRKADEERERLLDRERIAREAAESAGAKLSFLAEASHLLASSLDFWETLTRLSNLLVPRWADWCAIDIADEEGRPRRLSVAHQNPEKVQWAHELQRRYDPRPGGPNSLTAIAEGRTQYVPEISDDDLTAAARDDDHLKLLRDLGFSSLVVVPLINRGVSVGAITLVTAESGVHYSQEDVLFFEEVATRAAVAVENSRLFDEIRSLNQQLEQRVEQRTRELREALGELETFAYSVSHDLRAPLRGIDGFSQAMLEDYAGRLDEVAVQYLERIRGGARRMGELIDDLLTLSRLSQGELSHDRVDISSLATEIVSDLSAKEPEREVTVEIEPELQARGDHRLLRIALENIIGNAWKFTGVVERPRIEVGADRRDGETVYYVRDNGTGFDMNYSDKLFAPFQRLHAPHLFEGSGIGLATAQRVVRRHGGRIWAESRVGEGATFYFTLAA
jgi:PAS domain S-box-containing protein